jgi:hypothetical protein
LDSSGRRFTEAGPSDVSARGPRPSVSAAIMLAVCGVLATATAGTNAGASSDSTPAWCDMTLADLKTLSDPERGLVDLGPRKTTIRAINRLRRPQPTPTRRDNTFERHVWRVKAVILRDRLQADGDIQVILVAGHSYLIAELPAPACLSKTTRARAAIVRARRRFERGCGSPGRSWTNQGAVAYVGGVGLWNLANGQPGHAKNYAELHPVTSVKFVVGCDRP